MIDSKHNLLGSMSIYTHGIVFCECAVQPGPVPVLTGKDSPHQCTALPARLVTGSNYAHKLAEVIARFS